MTQDLKQELLERYESTGRVGLVKPKSKEEAYSMIDTIVEVYSEEPDESVITLKEIVQKLNDFFQTF